MCMHYKILITLLQIARTIYSISGGVLLLVYPTFVENFLQGIGAFQQYKLIIACLEIVQGVLQIFGIFTTCVVTDCRCDDCEQNCEYVLNSVKNLLSIGTSGSTGGLLVFIAYKSSNSIIIYGFATIELFYVLFYIVENILMASVHPNECCSEKTWSGIAFVFLLFRLFYCTTITFILFFVNSFQLPTSYMFYKDVIACLMAIQVLFLIFCLISISCNEDYNKDCTKSEKVNFTGPASMLSLFLSVFASIGAGSLEVYLSYQYKLSDQNEQYIQYYGFASVELLYCILYVICIVVCVVRNCVTYCGDSCYTKVLQILMIIRLFISFIIGLYNLLSDDSPQTDDDKGYIEFCGYIQVAQTVLNIICCIWYSMDVDKTSINYSSIPLYVSLFLCVLFGASGGLQYMVSKSKCATDPQRQRYYICFVVDLFYVIAYLLLFVMYTSKCRKNNVDCLKRIVEEKQKKIEYKDKQKQQKIALMIQNKENERKQKETEQQKIKEQIEQQKIQTLEQLRLKEQQDEDKLKRKIQECEDQRRKDEEQQQLQKLEIERKIKQAIEEQRTKNLEKQEQALIQQLMRDKQNLLERVLDLVQVEQQLQKTTFLLPNIILQQLVKKAKVVMRKITVNQIAQEMMDQKQWESITHIPLENKVSFEQCYRPQSRLNTKNSLNPVRAQSHLKQVLQISPQSHQKQVLQQIPLPEHIQTNSATFSEKNTKNVEVEVAELRLLVEQIRNHSQLAEQLDQFV